MYSSYTQKRFNVPYCSTHKLFYFRTSINLETHGCTIGRYRNLTSLPYPRNEETPSV